jgi:iron complex transport system substrate-binding protein
VLSDRLPSRETVLATAPDFVFAGWESNVAADGIGPRDLLDGYGIGSYVSPAACRTADRPARLSFEALFDEIEEAGRVFGAADAAARLVAEQRALLAAVQPIARALKVVWYSSGSDVPYVGAGSGMPQAIMDALGLANIASGIDDGWSSMSWEAVATAEPDLFILVDASWSSVQRKIAIIEASPLLGKLEAVRARRFLTIAFAASEAGVRSVPATVDLARQLHELIDE